VSAARIRVRAVPGSRRAEIVGRYGEGWKIRVTAAPERGRANDELVRLLSTALGVERGAIRVVAGQASRDKVIEIEGVEQEVAEARLGQPA